MDQNEAGSWVPKSLFGYLLLLAGRFGTSPAYYGLLKGGFYGPGSAALEILGSFSLTFGRSCQLPKGWLFLELGENVIFGHSGTHSEYDEDRPQNIQSWWNTPHFVVFN